MIMSLYFWQTFHWPILHRVTFLDGSRNQDREEGNLARFQTGSRPETTSLGLSGCIRTVRRVPGCLLLGAVGAKKGKNGPIGHFTTQSKYRATKESITYCNAYVDGEIWLQVVLKTSVIERDLPKHDIWVAFSGPPLWHVMTHHFHRRSTSLNWQNIVRVMSYIDNLTVKLFGNVAMLSMS